jgi:hypothetical protein
MSSGAVASIPCALRNSARKARPVESKSMQIQHSGVFLTIAWLLVIAAVQVALALTSAPALAVLVVLAVLPPLFVRRLLLDPPESMSQTIQAARR